MIGEFRRYVKELELDGLVVRRNDMMVLMTKRLLLVLAFAAFAVSCSTIEPLDLAEFPPDGVLDCTSDDIWGIQGDLDPNAEGFGTATEALANALAPFVEDNSDLQGPQEIRGGLSSLLDAQNREVVVASASEASPDNWFLTTLSGCTGFERF